MKDEELTFRRYAIDDGTDWSEAQAQVEALASAKPEERKRLSTVVSVKGKAEPKEEKKVVKRKASEGGRGNDDKKMKKRKST